MVPHLKKIEYKKEAAIPLNQIFEGHEDTPKHRKLAHKYKRENIEGIRFDLLHEENLSYLVELA